MLFKVISFAFGISIWVNLWVLASWVLNTLVGLAGLCISLHVYKAYRDCFDGLDSVKRLNEVVKEAIIVEYVISWLPFYIIEFSYKPVVLVVPLQAYNAYKYYYC